MTEWPEGYVTDTSYAETFFRELSPAWINYVAAVNGLTVHPLRPSFTYLELGCGVGGSVVVNAAAFPQGEFHACDLNPAHVDAARSHAEALDVGNVVFHGAAFDRVLSLDLPPFDFITLHGVYSWVGAEDRLAIRRIIHERLKPGGFVYLSYNCLPGWSAEIPLRRLLLELAASAGGSDAATRAEGAVRSLQRLREGRFRYFSANNPAAAAIDAYSRSAAPYLAHEFMNEAWEPFYSVDVASDMEDLGLAYVGSATLADNHPALVLDAASAEALATLATPRQRALAEDFAVNRRFRRDVFVRPGPRQTARAPGGADGAASHAALEASAVGRLGSVNALATTIRVPRGEIGFQEAFVRELRDLMGRGSMTMGAIASALSGAGRRGPEILRNLSFLVAAGTLTPFAAAELRPLSASRRLRPLVDRVLARAVERWTRAVVPSTTLGNGLPLDPLEALALVEWAAAPGGSGRQDDQDETDTPVSLALRVEAVVRQRVRTGLLEAPRLGDGDLTAACQRAAADTIDGTVPCLRRLGLVM